MYFIRVVFRVSNWELSLWWNYIPVYLKLNKTYCIRTCTDQCCSHESGVAQSGTSMMTLNTDIGCSSWQCRWPWRTWKSYIGLVGPLQKSLWKHQEIDPWVWGFFSGKNQWKPARLKFDGYIYKYLGQSCSLHIITVTIPASKESRLKHSVWSGIFSNEWPIFSRLLFQCVIYLD